MAEWSLHFIYVRGVFTINPENKNNSAMVQDRAMHIFYDFFTWKLAIWTHFWKRSFHRKKAVVGNFFTPPPIFWMVSELMEWPAGSFFTLFNKEKATCDRLGENMRFGWSRRTLSVANFFDRLRQFLAISFVPVKQPDFANFLDMSHGQQLVT